MIEQSNSGLPRADGSPALLRGCARWAPLQPRRPSGGSDFGAGFRSDRSFSRKLTSITDVFSRKDRNPSRTCFQLACAMQGSRSLHIWFANGHSFCSIGSNGMRICASDVLDGCSRNENPPFFPLVESRTPRRTRSPRIFERYLAGICVASAISRPGMGHASWRCARKMAAFRA